MTRLIEIIRENGELYGITNHYTGIKLNPGDKFKFQNKRYRVGHEGNYFADIPWWDFHKIINKNNQ